MGGYLGIATNGHTQHKRNPTQILDFVVQNDTILDVSAKVSLSNPNNKQGFIDLLSDKINAKTRLTAKKCIGDADRSMVTTALEALELHKPGILKADDTDVLVMCLAESQTSERGREGRCIFFIKRFKYSKLQDHGSNQYFLYNIMVQTHKMEIMNIGTGNTYIDV